MIDLQDLHLRLRAAAIHAADFFQEIQGIFRLLKSSKNLQNIHILFCNYFPYSTHSVQFGESPLSANAAAVATSSSALFYVEYSDLNFEAVCVSACRLY